MVALVGEKNKKKRGKQEIAPVHFFFHPHCVTAMDAELTGFTLLTSYHRNKEELEKF